MGIIRAFSVFIILLFSSSLWAAEYVPGEVIIKMKKKASLEKTHQFIGKASLRHKMSLKKSWTRLRMHRFALKPGQTVDQAINDLSFDPDVEYVEPNYIFKKQSVGIEGAPLSASEVQAMSVEKFSGVGSFGLTNVDVNVEEAWDALSTTSNVPVVAIIDSGVDYNHYVLQDSNAMWVNDDEIPNNGIDDDNNGYIDDVHGYNFAYNNNDPMDDDNHGTHVAGIILGMTQDILAATVQPAQVKIMALKFLDSTGQGTTSDAIEAINYAMANGATILNNSWGGPSYSQALHDAVSTAYSGGLTFVAAAGNAQNNNDAAPTYPASYDVPNVLSIAATNSIDDLATFSNYGASSVHVGSPGVSVLSLLPNDSFGYSSGTSMAAPLVAGLAALLKIEAGAINGYQMKNIIFNNSKSIGLLSNKVASQARIDAALALGHVQGTTIENYQPEYTPSSREVSSTGAAGGCGMVAKMLGKGKDGSGKPPWGTSALIITLLFAPMVIIAALKRRQRKEIENRRQHTRYKIDSDVKINVDGREFVGSVSSISLGGARVDTEAMLEQGGVVTMSIASPDGQQQIEVQGRVVWSEEKKAYGVQFTEAKDDVLSAIGGWTKKLKVSKT